MSNIGFRLGLAFCLLITAATCRPPVEGKGWNVLLISLETTRADHLGTYGYERDTSPRLDALAAEGTLFESMSVVSPRTNPSLASLMTGSYPHEHGVRNLAMPLNRSQTTLAEVLKRSGYVTGAVQTHPRLIRTSGFEQGFDDYADDFRAHPLAPDVTRVGLEWIAERDAERPWFLWLHYMDPHWTYDPPAPWRTRYGPDDPRPGDTYRAIERGETTYGEIYYRNRMPPDEVAAFVNFYDAEIRFTDEAIGALVDELDRQGLLDNTLIVLTADHGEALGEHDYFFEHGDFGTEPEIHIPTFFRGPAGAGIPSGPRIPWTVGNVDIAPTVLDLLELQSVGAWSGRSLKEFLDNPSFGDHRQVFGETGRNFHPKVNLRRGIEGVEGKWRWVREGRFKMVHRPVRKGGAGDAIEARRFLYDLESDPGEIEDVGETFPDVSARLGAALDAWLAGDEGGDLDYNISPEVREQLRSLGYID